MHDIKYEDEDWKNEAIISQSKLLLMMINISRYAGKHYFWH